MLINVFFLLVLLYSFICLDCQVMTIFLWKSWLTPFILKYMWRVINFCVLPNLPIQLSHFLCKSLPRSLSLAPFYFYYFGLHHLLTHLLMPCITLLWTMCPKPNKIKVLGRPVMLDRECHTLKLKSGFQKAVYMFNI